MRTLIILLAAIAVVSCAKPLYTPEPRVHVEYVDRLKVDSVFMRDSTMVQQRGDTVYLYRDRYLYKYRMQKDTVFVRDSVPYPVDVEKEVRYIPRIYKWSMWACLALLAVVLGRIRKPLMAAGKALISKL